MAISQAAKEAVEAAVASSARVCERARSVSTAIANRPARMRTNPFIKVDDFFDEEDSLVTSIESVVASAKKGE